MQTMTDTESKIERETVEHVFGLTGGELDDAPLSYTDEDGAEHVFSYSYDGAPEYTEGQFSDAEDDYRVFTAIGCYVYSAPPARITVGGRVYELKATFVSSGECACPCDGCDEDPFEGQICPYCEREIGEEHGCAYLGEGWLEAVYVTEESEDE